MQEYTKIGRLMPKKIRLWIKRQVDYSSFRVNPDTLIGFTILFGIGVGIVGGLLASQLTELNPFLIAALFFPGFLFLIYMWLEFSADSKSKFIEDVLPDALQIISSNIRAGLTLDKAMLMATREEFGPLGMEIRRIGKETMTGENIATAMLKTKKRVRSKHMDMVINLMIQSIESGGALADLLDETANDLRDQQMIQKEIRASVLMYVFFIFIAVGFGGPLLFSISSMLVKVLSANMALITDEMPADFAGMQGIPISMEASSISAEFIVEYIMIALVVTSFFGSIALGLILKGDEKTGLKFLPILGVMSIAVYKISSMIIDHYVMQMFPS